MLFFGIKKLQTTSYYRKSNGLSENLNTVVKLYIRFFNYLELYSYTYSYTITTTIDTIAKS